MSENNNTCGSNEHDVNSLLIRHLSHEGEIVPISKRFAVLTKNSHRVDFVYELLKSRNLLPALLRDGKKNETSLEFRQKGNEKFKFKKCKEALELYTKSALYAEKDSENLGLAYANRSAVLFENGLYNECLSDIKRAFQNNYPQKLKEKLISRQEKATAALNSQIFDLKHTTSVPSIPEESRNPLIQCASNAIKIEYHPDLGRHIVATRDIEVGEIFVIEKPYCHLLIEQFYDHCHNCLKLCYNLLPCSGCTQTLYCSEDCQKEAFAYHRFECPIISTTKKIEMDKLKLLPMRIALLETKSFLSKDCESQSEEYHSDRYKEIHNLVANTEKRSVSDLFDRTVTATVIFYLIKKYTDYFENCDNDLEDVFKDLVLLHLQTSACNFHEINETRNIRSSATYLDEIGAGAYSFLSMFNHSCSPNFTRYSYGCLMLARAIETIRKGQQCMDNYGEHHALRDKLSRSKKLAKQYFFECKCVACINNYPLYGELPVIPNAPEVEPYDFIKLRSEDLKDVMELLEKLTRKIKIVDQHKLKPNKNLADLQEVLKQCFFTLSNIDTPF